MLLRPRPRKYSYKACPTGEVTVFMFYEVEKNDHGLPHDPLKAIVAPRPIGWISSLNQDGVPNLAPYSFFNLVAAPPPVVMFSSATPKDSQNNI